MPDRPQQLELFDPVGREPAAGGTPRHHHRLVVDATLDDEALVAALGDVSHRDGAAIAAEIGRRRIVAAVPALQRMCRLHAAFGVHGVSREQDAALDALAQIRGPAAVEALVRLIERGDVCGASQKKALGIAADLNVRLPAERIQEWLDDPALRPEACRLARRWPSLAPLLVRQLGDGDPDVSTVAACVLAEMGAPAARPMILALLRSAPTEAVIEAVVGIADETCLVELGRLARSGTALADVARDALAASDHPRAASILKRLAGAGDADDERA